VDDLRDLQAGKPILQCRKRLGAIARERFAPFKFR
jgi:hypothetical protein